MNAGTAYDGAASTYDDIATRNPIQQHMRRLNLESILRAMPRGGRLLELGCGTGVELAEVASRLQASVIACEPSPKMAELAKKRATQQNLDARFITETASTTLDHLSASGETFDGAWASFSIGYDAALEQLAPKLAAVLRPGAPLIMTVRNPWCIAEPWSMPVRSAGRYRHKVGTARVEIHHASLRRAKAAFETEFLLEAAQALPLILPPPRYGRVLGAVPRLIIGGIARVDAVLGSLPGLRALGDHTLLQFRRLPGRT